MANNLYNFMNGNSMNLMDQMRMLRANPIQFLMQRRLNIPDSLQNNPQGIVQHLLNTGQMSQDQFNQLQSYVNKYNHAQGM